MKKGLRHILVPLDLMGEILRGKSLGEALNVPADLTVHGSETRESVLLSTGKPYPKDAIVLLCGSDEWEGVCDAQGHVLEFSPEYRRVT